MSANFLVKTPLKSSTLKAVKATTKKKSHFLRLLDLSATQLQNLLALAAEVKAHPARYSSALAGKSVALYFEKPSTRTRVSFEVGLYQLGAFAITLKPEEVGLGSREPIADVARTLAGYVDAVMLRTFSHDTIQQFANANAVPVINGLSDMHHPCQLLADLLTMQEAFGPDLKGHHVVFAGDGSCNMAHSWLEAGALLGIHVTLACPQNYCPDADILAECQALAKKTDACLQVSCNIADTVKTASVVYTDVWTSMGFEAEAMARQQALSPYQINQQLLAVAPDNAILLHCLPAHRGEEVDTHVMDAHAKTIFRQAENRMHGQKALLLSLLNQVH